jgi:hypothetical protein
MLRGKSNKSNKGASIKAYKNKKSHSQAVYKTGTNVLLI